MSWVDIGDGNFMSTGEVTPLDLRRAGKRKMNRSLDGDDTIDLSDDRPTRSQRGTEIELDNGDDDIIWLRDIPTPFPFPIKPHRCKCRVGPSMIDSHGMGLQANSVIERGEIIIVENPFLIIDYPIRPSRIRRSLRTLSAGDLLLFQSFKGSSTDTCTHDYLKIVENNVIPLGVEETEEGEEVVASQSGMFRHICRVNHSCVPNSRWTWHDDESKMELKAILPIADNEEITANYLDDQTELFAPRQEFLRKHWGFTCRCKHCRLEPWQLKASDERLNRYRKIEAEFIGIENSENWQLWGFETCWTKIKESIGLLELEERYERVAESWDSLFHLSVMWGESDRAIEAGECWSKELAKTRDQLDQIILDQIQHPEDLEGWSEFVASNHTASDAYSEPESDETNDNDAVTRSSRRRHSITKHADPQPILLHKYRR